MQVFETTDRQAIERLRAAGEFFWLDRVGPSDEEIDELAEIFDLHPLVVEDMKKFDQRPKLLFGISPIV